MQAEQAKAVAVEKALAEGRARAQEHRENRDIFMEEISKSAAEWGKQYMLLLQARTLFGGVNDMMNVLFMVMWGKQNLLLLQARAEQYHMMLPFGDVKI